MTSNFGYRISDITGEKEFHNGTDIALEENTVLKAVKSGKIIYTEEKSGYGKACYMITDDGYGILYAHLNGYLKTSGQYVRMGESVAYSGNTGVSTGPHLHLSIVKDGRFLNPEEYIDFSD